MARQPKAKTSLPPRARTSGQAGPDDPPDAAIHETIKTEDLAPNKAEPGPFLTTNQGLAVSDDQNSLRAGVRGPTLLEDILMREKITHFDHERIPERVVHARGAAAHGFFQVYEDLSDLTAATLFHDPKARTPVFVRFSTVAGSRGSTDTPRDVRGFAVKFYTQDGVWDGAAMNKGLTLKMGQTHVQKYTKPLLAKIEAGEIDPSFVVTHPASLEDAPEMYKKFRDKKDGVIKVVMKPGT